jgi:hypothetical protein
VVPGQARGVDPMPQREGVKPQRNRVAKPPPPPTWSRSATGPRRCVQPATFQGSAQAKPPRRPRTPPHTLHVGPRRRRPRPPQTPAANDQRQQRLAHRRRAVPQVMAKPAASRRIGRDPAALHVRDTSAWVGAVDPRWAAVTARVRKPGGDNREGRQPPV